MVMDGLIGLDQGASRTGWLMGRARDLFEMT